jgi:microcystin-dependent protein
MPSTFSPSLRIELIGAGEQAGTWNVTTNNNLGELIEQAIAGRTTVDVTAGNVTLTSLNGVVDEARSAVLAVTGTPGVTRVITIPNVEKAYTLINQTTNIVQVKTASGTAFNCPPSATTVIACDGSNGVQGSGVAPLTSPAFTGTPTAPTAAGGTNTTQLATTAFVTTALSAALPTGVIMLWSGSIASVPSGWALCNGTSGTPDLRDRFVVGAGTTYAVNATGGANTVTLDTTQIPSHTHTGSGTTASANVDHTHSGTTSTVDINHTHTGSGTTGGQNANHGHSGSTDAQGLHQHTLATAPSENASPRYPWGQNNATAGQEKQTSGGVYVAPLPFSSQEGIHNHNVSTDIQNADHGHAYSFTSSAMSANNTHNHTVTTGGMSANADHTHTFSFTSAATGGGAAHENRPPYYALAYIMKV